MLAFVHFACVAEVAVIKRILNDERYARRVYALLASGKYTGIFKKERKVVEGFIAGRITFKEFPHKCGTFLVDADFLGARIVYVPDRRKTRIYTLSRLLSESSCGVGCKLTNVFVCHAKFHRHHEDVIGGEVGTVVGTDMTNDPLLEEPLNLSAVYRISCETIYFPAQDSVRFAVLDAQYHFVKDRAAGHFGAPLLNEFSDNF